jgi:acetylornithine deacetylase
VNDAERAVLAAIDDDEIVRWLDELVAIPSVDGTDAELDAQRWGADRLRQLGLDVDEWEVAVADLRTDPAFPGMEVDRTAIVGCVGTLGDAGTPAALALCGHTDVVPPGDLALWPDGGPFAMRIDGGRAWGRGTCDMKGGVAAVLGAVAAVARSGAALRRPLAVHLVSGEEDGGTGAFATLRRGHRAETCVIAEPTDHTIIPANAGSLTFQLAVPGLATHGSTRTRGVSAVEKFELVHAALRRLEAERNRSTPPLFAHLDLAWPLSVGILRAGDWASTVPDHLVAEGRYGVRVDEDVATARTAFEAAVAEACAGDPWLAGHPVSVTWPGGTFAPGALPEGHRLLDDTRSAITAAGGPHPAVAGGPYGSDLRHYAAAGVATLQYGPGAVANAHAVDEHVVIDDVLRCARTYALLALGACG